MTNYIGQIDVQVTGSSGATFSGSYHGQVTVNVDLEAFSILIFNYIGLVEVDISVSNEHTVDYFYGNNDRWSVYNNTEYSFNYTWIVGQEPFRWYTVEFRCPTIQTSAGGQLADCPTPGTNIVGDPRCDGCDPGGTRYFQVVAARGLSDLCNRLKQRFLTEPINCPIVSVKRGRLVHTADQDASNETCNILEQLPEDEYCLIPSCMDFCLDEILYSFVGVKSFYQRVFSYEGEIEINLATTPQYFKIYQGQIGIDIDGSSDVENSYYEYEGEITVVIDGSSDVENSYYEYEGEIAVDVSIGSFVEYARFTYIGNIATDVSAESFSRNSYLGEFETAVAAKSFLTDLIFVPSEIVQDNTLTIADSTVATTCGCNNLPLVLRLGHNIADDNYLGNFLVRNRLTLNSPLDLFFRKDENAWINNFHFVGMSEDGITQERWNGFFEWACTNEIADETSTLKFWKLSVFVRRQNLTSLQDFDTRLLFGLPTNICVNNELDFGFSINAFTQQVKSDNNFLVDTRILYDNIGLFKNQNWIKNPNITFNITETVLEPPTEQFDIRPIFSKQSIFI